uniref:Uncharacterized protein n=1 Tax=Arundo donax TaxID=35708 RepID=A0A0A9EX90_ARUDO
MSSNSSCNPSFFLFAKHFIFLS